MQRQALMAFAATLIFGSASALAQGGSLAGVTMRVLDDISGIDAVVLDLDANSATGDESRAVDGPQAPTPAEEAADAAPDEPTDDKRELRDETEGEPNRSP